MDAVKVTVAIPVFNCERWIGSTIEAALDQTWPRSEVIVVDDGSNDRTSDICESFGNRIRFLRQTNRGGNAARNLALHQASGEWIQYLDADDSLHPTKIQSQIEVAAPDSDIICSPVTTEHWSENRLIGETEQQLGPNPDWYALWLRWNMPQTGGCLWRKSALSKIGGWNEAFRFNQDYELYFRALTADLRFQFVDAPLAVYRIWSENTVCRKDKTAVISGITELVHQFLDWLRSVGRWTPEYERLASLGFFSLARTLAVRDLRIADQYYKERKREGLMQTHPGAAPLKYRLALKCFGFRNAEQLARVSRSFQERAKELLHG
jgi:glycosyltransferase involved in cell wall biosynthesis